MRRLLLAVCFLPLVACRVTSHQAPPVQLGQASSSAAMRAALAAPGPITFERVVAADWAVPLSGLLDLDHPVAEAGGLEDRDEPIQIYMYVLRHPEHGTFLVDSGVSQAIADGDLDVFGWAVQKAMATDKIRVRRTTQAWVAEQTEPVRGVFVTHLHMDHIIGLADLPADTPVYVGPGEVDHHLFVNMFVQGSTDRALEGHTLRALEMPADPEGPFEAVLDVFGDGSLFAIHTGGHTAGHLALVARTPEGPVLMTGDASHTTWGFAHGVPPGSYSEDHEVGAAALDALVDLARAFPEMRIHCGHQSFEDPHAKAVLHP